MKLVESVFVSSLAVASVMSLTSETCVAQVQTNLTVRAIPAVEVSFQGVLGGTYTLESTTNLADPNGWQYVTTFIGSSNGQYSYDAFANGQQMFYQVVLGIRYPASAVISLDPSTPPTQSVGVLDTAQGSYLGLTVLTFDVSAQGDNLHLHQVPVTIPTSGNGDVTAAYLYNGSTEVCSAAVVNGVAVFQNIVDGTAGATIQSNSVAAFTVKLDVSGLTGQASYENVQAIVNASNIVVFNSQDIPVTAVTGSAVGNVQQVFGQGPEFSLAGAPAFSKVNITPGGSTNTMFKYIATFDVNVFAVGENITFGLPNASQPSFGSTNTSTNVAKVYEDGVPAVSPPIVSAAWSQPSDTTLSSDGTYFTVSENQTVTIPVTYIWIVTNPDANTYAIALDEIIWSSGGSESVSTLQGIPGWMTLPE